MSDKSPSNYMSTPKNTFKNLNRDIPDAIDDQIKTISILNHKLIPDKLQSRLKSINNAKIFVSYNDNLKSVKRKEKKMDNINLTNNNKFLNT